MLVDVVSCTTVFADYKKVFCLYLHLSSDSFLYVFLLIHKVPAVFSLRAQPNTIIETYNNVLMRRLFPPLWFLNKLDDVVLNSDVTTIKPIIQIFKALLPF
jgi:hypothetical protein